MKYGNTMLELYLPLQFPRQIFGTFRKTLYLCNRSGEENTLAEETKVAKRVNGS